MRKISLLLLVVSSIPALSTCSTNAEDYYNRGVVLLEKNMLNSAASAFRKAINSNPGYVKAYYGLGMVHFRNKLYEEAKENLTMAISKDPSFHKAYTAMGNVCFETREYVIAIDHFQKASQLDPNIAENHLKLGLTYGQLGDAQQEIIEYKKALEIDPNYKPAKFKLRSLEQQYTHKSDKKKQSASQVTEQLLSSDLHKEMELQKITIPIWSNNDIKEPATTLEFESEVVGKTPPFYKGPLPLNYTGIKEYLAPDILPSFYYDFGVFRNIFIYKDGLMKGIGVAEGAITIDPSGKLLAEARLIDHPFSVERITIGEPTIERKIDNEKERSELTIEEFHYNKVGELIFKCKSLVKVDSGVKEREFETIGAKIRDYYFIWPTTSYR